jgi:penicillin-binding protein 1A
MPPWRPENYSAGKYNGPSTLRFGIEQSRNTMTVRLAQDVGMPLIVEYARRFGVYDNLPTFLSYSLGAGETTVLRMVTAYSMFDNGGKRIIPTFIDRIQDRYGRTVYRHDQRECRECKADNWKDQPSRAWSTARAGDRSDDRLPDHLDHGRRRAARHRHGGALGRQADRRQDRHHQRREGRLVHRLFADIAVGVYLGYDKPRHIGNRATGGGLAAPIVADFLKVALADKPAVPFRVPAGIKLIRVDARSGMRVGPGAEGRIILEAFKPGTAPPDSYSVVGASDQAQQQDSGYNPGYINPTPYADRAARRGTGFTKARLRPASARRRSCARAGQRFKTFAQALDHALSPRNSA